MREVSEAKYTYWRTIVELGKNSGMPEEDWCRKNCISFKTYRHYDGIFRRQEARKSSYIKRKRPDQGIAERKDNEELVPTGSPDDADEFEVVSARSNENDEGIKDKSLTDDNAIKFGDGQGETNTKDSKYFEVPLDALKSDQTGPFPITEDVEQETGECLTGYESNSETRNDATEIMSHSGASASNEQNDIKEAIIIETGGLKLVLGNDVDMETLNAVLRAVQSHA